MTQHHDVVDRIREAMEAAVDGLVISPPRLARLLVGSPEEIERLREENRRLRQEVARLRARTIREWDDQ